MIGVVVGFLALTTSVPLTIELTECDKQEQSTSKEEEKAPKEVLKAFEAINSTAQINLDHAHLLLETLPSFVDEKDEEVPSEQKSFLAGNKILQILFSRIISPNAP